MTDGIDGGDGDFQFEDTLPFSEGDTVESSIESYVRAKQEIDDLISEAKRSLAAGHLIVDFAFGIEAGEQVKRFITAYQKVLSIIAQVSDIRYQQKLADETLNEIYHFLRFVCGFPPANMDAFKRAVWDMDHRYGRSVFVTQEEYRDPTIPALLVIKGSSFPPSKLSPLPVGDNQVLQVAIPLGNGVPKTETEKNFKRAFELLYAENYHTVNPVHVINTLDSFADELVRKVIAQTDNLSADSMDRRALINLRNIAIRVIGKKAEESMRQLIDVFYKDITIFDLLDSVSETPAVLDKCVSLAQIDQGALPVSDIFDLLNKIDANPARKRVLRAIAIAAVKSLYNIFTTKNNPLGWLAYCFLEDQFDKLSDIIELVYGRLQAFELQQSTARAILSVRPKLKLTMGGPDCFDDKTPAWGTPDSILAGTRKVGDWQDFYSRAGEVVGVYSDASNPSRHLITPPSICWQSENDRILDGLLNEIAAAAEEDIGSNGRNDVPDGAIVVRGGESSNFMPSTAEDNDDRRQLNGNHSSGKIAVRDSSGSHSISPTATDRHGAGDSTEVGATGSNKPRFQRLLKSSRRLGQIAVAASALTIGVITGLHHTKSKPQMDKQEQAANGSGSRNAKIAFAGTAEKVADTIMPDPTKAASREGLSKPIVLVDNYNLPRPNVYDATQMYAGVLSQEEVNQVRDSQLKKVLSGELEISANGSGYGAQLSQPFEREIYHRIITKEITAAEGETRIAAIRNLRNSWNLGSILSYLETFGGMSSKQLNAIRFDKKHEQHSLLTFLERSPMGKAEGWKQKYSHLRSRPGAAEAMRDFEAMEADMLSLGYGKHATDIHSGGQGGEKVPTIIETKDETGRVINETDSGGKKYMSAVTALLNASGIHDTVPAAAVHSGETQYREMRPDNKTGFNVPADAAGNLINGLHENEATATRDERRKMLFASGIVMIPTGGENTHELALSAIKNAFTMECSTDAQQRRMEAVLARLNSGDLEKCVATEGGIYARLAPRSLSKLKSVLIPNNDLALLNEIDRGWDSPNIVQSAIKRAAIRITSNNDDLLLSEIDQGWDSP